jgi:3'(2'), 5'-bisphosphate nucleotidase
MTATAHSPADRDRIARLLAEIASSAGVAVMDVYATDFAARTKADSSPVSDADERAEEIILARLATDLPGVPVLAEEMAARDGVGVARGRTFLLVDPVDGTKEFIRRNGAFTVNIALIEDGRTVAGCVFAPARNEMFFGGATARSADGFAAGDAVAADSGRQLLTRPYPGDGLTAVTSSSHLDSDTKDFLKRHGITRQTAIGSSLKFCLVARGEADVYPRFGPTMEWDTAAGQAVLEAAGGTVTTPMGARFTYGKSDNGFTNGPFIAWGREPL